MGKDAGLADVLIGTVGIGFLRKLGLGAWREMYKNAFVGGLTGSQVLVLVYCLPPQRSKQVFCCEVHHWPIQSLSVPCFRSARGGCSCTSRSGINGSQSRWRGVNTARAVLRGGKWYEEEGEQ